MTAKRSKRKQAKPKVDCVACRAKIPENSIVCEVCGAPQRELDPCPHCRGKGSVKINAELQLECNLCGGPRVPHLPEDLEASGKEKASLVKANAARKSRGLWRTAGILGGFAVPFAFLFALVIGLIFGFTSGLVTALVMGGPFAILAGYAYQRNTAKTKEMAMAIDQAWVSLAMDLAEQFEGRMRTKDLSDALGIDMARAEQLMAMLSLDEVLQTRPRTTVAPDERFLRLEEQLERESHPGEPEVVSTTRVAEATSEDEVGADVRAEEEADAALEEAEAALASAKTVLARNSDE